jgi:hypothetical protein
VPGSISTGTGRTPRTVGVRVANPGSDWNSFNATFQASGRTMADIKAHAPTCTDATGTVLPLCLSYHIRGACFDNCGRAASHRPLTASDRSALTDFASQHLPPPTPQAS